MRVLQIIPSFDTGGAEKVVIDYITYSKDVEMVGLSLFEKSDSVYNHFIEENKLNVIYLDKKPGLDLSMIRKVQLVIDRLKPDVVHSHLPILKYLIPTIRKYRKEIKFFHTIHNEPEKDAVGIDYHLNKLAFRRLGVTPIALTIDLAEATNKYYGINNSLVLGNGIDLDRFRNADVTNSLGLKDKFVVGHVGRFSNQKNHAFLIDIFNEIVKLRDDVALLLVGDGELRDSIEDKVKQLDIQEKVLFLGIRKDIPEIAKQFDVFLFPSLHEGLPITLIEVQAAGVKSVISDVIDPQVILSEQTIRVGLSESAQTWAETVLDPTCKNETYQSFDDFDVHTVLEKLVEIYKL